MSNGDWYVSLMIDLQLSLLAVATALVVWSAVVQVRRASSAQARGRRRSAWIAVVGTALLLAATFFTAPAEALPVNGQMCTSALQLRLASMFVTTSLVLLTVAVVAIIVSHISHISQHQRR